MEIVIYILIFIIGSFIGSFSSLAVYRIPKKVDITHKHSYCPNCNHKLQVLDLIPIFSYLFLRGKCRYCNQKIRIRYLLLEIFSGLLFLIFAISLKFDFRYIEVYKIIYFVIGSIYITTLIVIAGIDKENYNINKPLIVFGIIIATIYILYLYTLENNSIYRYAIYLAIILLLVVLDTILLKKKKKANYTIQILTLCFYMLLFTDNETIVLTIILALILVAANMINIIIEKRKIVKNNNIILKGNVAIPIGFYLCITNIFALILQTYLFFNTSG